MFRVFYIHKKLGKYCIKTYTDTPLTTAISEVKGDFIKSSATSCQIVDDKDKVVWEFPKRKKQNKITLNNVRWTVSIPKQEAYEINNTIQNAGISKIEFIRFAIEKLKENT